MLSSRSIPSQENVNLHQHLVFSESASAGTYEYFPFFNSINTGNKFPLSSLTDSSKKHMDYVSSTSGYLVIPPKEDSLRAKESFNHFNFYGDCYNNITITDSKCNVVENIQCLSRENIAALLAIDSSDDLHKMPFKVSLQFVPHRQLLVALVQGVLELANKVPDVIKVFAIDIISASYKPKLTQCAFFTVLDNLVQNANVMDPKSKSKKRIPLFSMDETDEVTSFYVASIPYSALTPKELVSLSLRNVASNINEYFYFSLKSGLIVQYRGDLLKGYVRPLNENTTDYSQGFTSNGLKLKKIFKAEGQVSLHGIRCLIDSDTETFNKLDGEIDKSGMDSVVDKATSTFSNLLNFNINWTERFSTSKKDSNSTTSSPRKDLSGKSEIPVTITKKALRQSYILIFSTKLQIIRYIIQLGNDKASHNLESSVQILNKKSRLIGTPLASAKQFSFLLENLYNLNSSNSDDRTSVESRLLTFSDISNTVMLLTKRANNLELIGFETSGNKNIAPDDVINSRQEKYRLESFDLISGSLEKSIVLDNLIPNNYSIIPIEIKATKNFVTFLCTRFENNEPVKKSSNFVIIFDFVGGRVFYIGGFARKSENKSTNADPIWSNILNANPFIDTHVGLSAFTILLDDLTFYTLNEVSLSEKLTYLLPKHDFTTAFDTLKTCSSLQLKEFNMNNSCHRDNRKAVETIIYKRLGDHLYDLGRFDACIGPYIKTLDYIDSSEIIGKFLDSQRIEALTKYLTALYRFKSDTVSGKSCRPHETSLLLNCFATLGNITSLNSLLVDIFYKAIKREILHTSMASILDAQDKIKNLNHFSTRDPQEAFWFLFGQENGESHQTIEADEFESSDDYFYYPSISEQSLEAFINIGPSIDICRQTGFIRQAFEIAKLCGRHDICIELLVQDLNCPQYAVKFLGSLGSHDDVLWALYKYGHQLVTACPKDMNRVLLSLCQRPAGITLTTRRIIQSRKRAHTPIPFDNYPSLDYNPKSLNEVDENEIYKLLVPIVPPDGHMDNNNELPFYYEHFLSINNHVKIYEESNFSEATSMSSPTNSKFVNDNYGKSFKSSPHYLEHDNESIVSRSTWYSDVSDLSISNGSSLGLLSFVAYPEEFINFFSHCREEGISFLENVFLYKYGLDIVTSAMLDTGVDSDGKAVNINKIGELQLNIERVSEARKDVFRYFLCTHRDRISSFKIGLILLDEYIAALGSISDKNLSLYGWITAKLVVLLSNAERWAKDEESILQALDLCIRAGYEQGCIILYKILDMKAELLDILYNNEDYEGIVRVCLESAEQLPELKQLDMEYGDAATAEYVQLFNERTAMNKSLWTSAISFFATKLAEYQSKLESDNNESLKSKIEKTQDSLREILKQSTSNHIFTSVELIRVLSSKWISRNEAKGLNENFKHSGTLSLGVIREFLLKILSNEETTINQLQGKIDLYQNETKTLFEKINILTEETHKFDNEYCDSCGTPLELPIIRFRCNHGYHRRCLQPKLTSDSLNSELGELGELDRQYECILCARKHEAVLLQVKTVENADYRANTLRSELFLANPGDKFNVLADWFSKISFSS